MELEKCPHGFVIAYKGCCAECDLEAYLKMMEKKGALSMLKNGDRVVYDGIETTCMSDEFRFLGTGPLVVELEDFEGWVNAELPKKLDKR